ncbi:hypothetical protein ABIF15_007723 [Bradyrhizobium elkanii]
MAEAESVAADGAADVVARLKRRIIGEALPLWSTAGWDGTAGGFVDRLHQDGTADRAAPRRIMVQARQIYCYAKAAQLGWYPEGRAIALKGLDYLLAKAKAPDGRPGFVYSVTAEGGVHDPLRDTYGHAFVLLALATVYGLDQDAQIRAEIDALLSFLDTQLRSPHGGFREGLPPSMPRRQNPQMHLFEAMIACFDATHDLSFQNRAGDFFALFLATLYDKQTRTLGEYFEEDWSRIPAGQRRARAPRGMGLAAEGIRADHRLSDRATARRAAGFGAALSRRGHRLPGRRGRRRGQHPPPHTSAVAAERAGEGVDRAGRVGRSRRGGRGACGAGAARAALSRSCRGRRLVRSVRPRRQFAGRHDPGVVVLSCALRGH